TPPRATALLPLLLPPTPAAPRAPLSFLSTPPAPTHPYSLSLHDALPISAGLRLEHHSAAGRRGPLGVRRERPAPHAARPLPGRRPPGRRDQRPEGRGGAPAPAVHVPGSDAAADQPRRADRDAAPLLRRRRCAFADHARPLEGLALPASCLSVAAAVRHPGAPPPPPGRRSGARAHRRRLRDGGPAQLDRCLLQDLQPPSRTAVPLLPRGR